MLIYIMFQSKHYINLNGAIVYDIFCLIKQKRLKTIMAKNFLNVSIETNG